MSRLLKIFFIVAFVSVFLHAKNGMTKSEILAYVDSLGMPDWYYEIEDIKEGKKAFLDFLLPIIKEENEKIERNRLFIKEIFKKSYTEWNSEEILKISKLAKRYKIDRIFNKIQFEKKIAQIPVSLVLAQAAVESGWGKSRFVRDANNIFGQWTFGRIGIAPNERDDDKSHKLKLFKNIQESIAAYMLNLNRNRAYKEFREERFSFISKGMSYGGLVAAENMKRYSEIGLEYVAIIKTVILENELHVYDIVSA